MGKLSELLTSFKEMNYDIAPYNVFFSSRAALSGADALGFPLVMKIDSLIHKSRSGGVKTNIENEISLSEAWQSLRIRFDIEKEGAIVQKQISGVELIIGLKYDKSFKNMIMVGSGGTNAEEYNDVSFRLCPINTNDASQMLSELKLFPKISSEADMERLKDLLVRLSKLHYEMEFSSMDFNPVILNKEGCWLVDIRKE